MGAPGLHPTDDQTMRPRYGTILNACIAFLKYIEVRLFEADLDPVETRRLVKQKL
jgi:hypothetical protein